MNNNYPSDISGIYVNCKKLNTNSSTIQMKLTKTINPQKIKLIEDKILSIQWPDGKEHLIPLLKLRKLCPCATCLAEREKQSKSYIPVFTENQISIDQIKQVGNYAISIFWKDGHNTGIYEFTFLRLIGENSKE